MNQPKNEKDILKALDEMEQVSTELNSRKAKIEARIKKHVKPPTEVKRIDVINRQNREQIELATWKFKNKIVAFFTIGAAAEWFMYHDLAKGNMVDFVLFNIGAIGLGGMIKIKMINGRK